MRLTEEQFASAVEMGRLPLMTAFWVAAPGMHGKAFLDHWANHESDFRHMRRGLIRRTKEEAVAAADVMLAALRSQQQKGGSSAE